MQVAHRFVSLITDDGDPTLLSPTKWNDGHDLSLAASQRVVGRNAAGGGLAEEVTASQLLDWASNTDGVLLTRTAGTWGALANVTSDNGDLVLADSAAPPPGAGAKVFSKSLSGRSMPAFIGALNRAAALQPHVGQAAVGAWYMSSSVAVSSHRVPQISLTGTGTARSPTSTSLCSSLRRVGIVSAAGAGSIASLGGGPFQWIWRGNAAGLGGFHIVYRFAASDAVLVGTARMFVGIGGVYIDADPSTLTNLVGVGCDNGDTTLQLYSAGAAAQTRHDLGANFPVNNPSVDVYELALYAPPNGSSINYRVERLNTGDVTSGVISAGASLPASTTFMRPLMGRSNATTASAVGLDFISAYFETDF